MLRAGLFNESIETTRAEITFDLPIPTLCIKFRKPLPEPTKVLGRELAHGPLNVFYATHASNLPSRPSGSYAASNTPPASRPLRFW